MGKKIIWSPSSLGQLEQVFDDILESSKSLNIANRVVNDILKSVDIQSNQPEIYTLDKNKLNNDGTYRAYEVKTYNVAYRVLNDSVRIIRVRYSGREPKGY